MNVYLVKYKRSFIKKENGCQEKSDIVVLQKRKVAYSELFLRRDSWENPSRSIGSHFSFKVHRFEFYLLLNDLRNS